MAVLFSLLFTLVLLAVGFVFFCVLAIPSWLLFDRLALTGLSPARRKNAAFIAIPLCYVILIVCAALWLTQPAGVFHMAFGFPPSPDVQIQSANHSGIGDSGEHLLSFTADEQTVNRILRLKFKSQLSESLVGPDGNYRFKREYSEAFAFEISELTYDPRTSKVEYHWQGID